MRHLKGEKIAKFLGSLVAEAVPPAETLKEQAGGTDRRGRRRRKKKGGHPAGAASQGTCSTSAPLRGGRSWNRLRVSREAQPRQSAGPR